MIGCWATLGRCQLTMLGKLQVMPNIVFSLLDKGCQDKARDNGGVKKLLNNTKKMLGNIRKMLASTKQSLSSIGKMARDIW
jgi:hypothetical protein